MKKTIPLFLLILALPALFLFTPNADRFGANEQHYISDAIADGAVAMIAHRGYSAAAPENTLPAFRLAGENGFWGTECDVQRTADGRWVLMHDPTVDRMTNGSGKVSSMTYNEIAALTVDAGNNAAQYPNTKVPTLEEYLNVCRQYGLHAVIEIKKSVQTSDLPALASLLSAREEKARFLVISFKRELAAEMKKLMPETPVYLLIERTTADDIAFCVEHELNGLDLSYKKTSPVMIRAAHKAGLQTFAWTVDSHARVQALYSLGVSAITTNVLLPQTAR